MVEIILDLCGGTGAWSRHYRDNGYRVIIVDPLAEPHPDNYLGRVEDFLWDKQHGYVDLADADVVGILAAPPCTEFSGSGARWWASKEKETPGLLEAAMDTVITCYNIALYYRIYDSFNLRWWVMENPVGRMQKVVLERRDIDIGKWVMTFQPCDYGDPYTKRTCLWGDFTEPVKTPVEPTEGSKIHLMAPSEDRWRLRSMTPPGFAKAFFEANP